MKRAGLWLGMACLLSACHEADRAPILPHSHDILTRALYAPTLIFDPIYAKNSAEAALVRDLFAGLMRVDAQGELRPQLLKRAVSDDGKTWILQLDSQVRWSNGEPLTALDIVKSWQRLANPASRAPFARYLLEMDVKNADGVLRGALPLSALGVSALAADRLQIELNAPNFALENWLGHFALLPTYQGAAPKAKAFISSGDYQLKNASAQHVQLARAGDVGFTTVQYYAIASNEALTHVDLLDNPQAVARANFAPLETVDFPQNCQYAFWFNAADPRFQQKNVRKALQAMLSTEPIRLANAVPNSSVLPKSLQPLDYYAEPQIAENLLPRDEIALPIRFRLTVERGAREGAIAEQVARALSQSDLFRVQVEALNPSAFQHRMLRGDFELAGKLQCVAHNDPRAWLSALFAHDYLAKLGITHPKIDALFAKLQTQPLKNAAQKQIIQQISRYLDDNVAILPVVQFERQIGLNPHIKGIDLNNSSEAIYSRDLQFNLTLTP